MGKDIKRSHDASTVGDDVDLEPHVFEAGKANLAHAVSLAGSNTTMRGYIIEAAERLTGKSAGVQSPNDPRDKWMTDEKAAGKTHGEILAALRRDHAEWEQLDTEQAVGQAIKRYCERHGIDPPKRKKG